MEVECQYVRFFPLWAVCSAANCSTVETGGINTCGGFAGGTNATPANVRYMGAVTVSASSPKWSFTNSEFTDAAFAFSCRLTSASVS